MDTYVGAETLCQGLPVAHRADIQRQVRLHARREIGIQADEAALHLHMQAAGVGGAAGVAAVVQAQHVVARFGQEP